MSFKVGQLLRGSDPSSRVFGRLYLLIRVRHDDFFVESQGVIFDVLDFVTGETQGWMSIRFEKVE